MERYVAIGVLALMLSACSKPHDVVIPAELAEWDRVLVPAAKKLNDEDRALFSAYTARHLMAGALAPLARGTSGNPHTGIPLGMTIGQAIAEQRAFVSQMEAKAAEDRALKEKQKALDEKREAEAAKVRAAIDKVLSVSFATKGVQPANPAERQYRDLQWVEVWMHNKSPKEIAGVQGDLDFIDLFGEKVATLEIKATDSIRPSEMIVWGGERPYNQFEPSHRALHGLDKGKFKTEFRPTAVVFADGTSIKVEN